MDRKVLLACVVCTCVLAHASAARVSDFRDTVALSGSGNSCIELKSVEECDANAECTWCKTVKEIGSCVSIDFAKKLPKKIFTCDKPVDSSEGHNMMHGKAMADMHGKAMADMHGMMGKDSRCAKLEDADDCDDDDRCAWCKAFNDLGSVCVTMDFAKILPKALFTCDKVDDKVVEAKEVDCDSRKEGDCMAPDCVWCTSAAVGGGCFTPAEASKLPSAIFKCNTAPQSVA